MHVTISVEGAHLSLVQVTGVERSNGSLSPVRKGVSSLSRKHKLGEATWDLPDGFYIAYAHIHKTNEMQMVSVLEIVDDKRRDLTTSEWHKVMRAMWKSQRSQKKVIVEPEEQPVDPHMVAEYTDSGGLPDTIPSENRPVSQSELGRHIVAIKDIKESGRESETLPEVDDVLNPGSEEQPKPEAAQEVEAERPKPSLRSFVDESKGREKKVKPKRGKNADLFEASNAPEIVGEGGHSTDTTGDDVGAAHSDTSIDDQVSWHESHGRRETASTGQTYEVNAPPKSRRKARQTKPVPEPEDIPVGITPPSYEDLARKGAQAMGRVHTHATQTWDADWVPAGHGLVACQRIAVTEFGGSNSDEYEDRHKSQMGVVLKRFGFVINANDRSKLLAVMKILPGVQVWRAKLVDADRARWNNPRTVLQHYQKHTAKEAANTRGEPVVPQRKGLAANELTKRLKHQDRELREERERNRVQAWALDKLWQQINEKKLKPVVGENELRLEIQDGIARLQASYGDDDASGRKEDVEGET